MTVPERSHVLIQKYLDTCASESELVELEGLLAIDPSVASAFADAARLHAGLQAHFQKQYKIDQVAALLAVRAPVQAAIDTPPGKSTGDVIETGVLVPVRSIPVPTFVPGYRGLSAARRMRAEMHARRATRVGKWMVAGLLLLTIGFAIWAFNGAGQLQFSLDSGRVRIAGRTMTRIAADSPFEVIGKEAAVIQLAGDARIELIASTRGTFSGDSNQVVLHVASGGGDFRVPPNRPTLRIETVLGVVTTTGGQFSLDLVTTLPDHFSATGPVRLPTLAVVVTQGSVTIERAGVSTTLHAGQRRDFFL